MAEEKQKKENKWDKNKKEPKESKRPPQEDKNEILVRIFGHDVPGSRNLYAGLTKIKGVSWSIANAVCLRLGLNRNMRISEITKPQIAEIENFLKNMPLPAFMKNRRSDVETGATGHLFGADLDIKKEFDIKKMKKMKSYRGIRHGLRLPVRGQRTRSHFRQKGVSVGVIKGKAKESPKPKEVKK